MSRRTQRVAEQIRAELARVLREEALDPRLRLVTLTRVDVAPDLGNAVVFWSVMELGDGQSVAAVSEGLASAAGFLRGRLARELSLKRMPELRFRHDPSLALGSRTLSLLEAIADDEKA